MGSLPYRMAGLLLMLLGLTLVMPGPQPAFAAGKTVQIIVDGRQVVSDSAPVTLDERTYVPLRVVSENLGAQVEWRQDTGHIVINWHIASTPALPKAPAGEFPIIIDGSPLVIPPDYGKAFINSQYRVMVPLRAVGEALDCQVNWDQDSYAVLIQSKPAQPVSDEQRVLLDLAKYNTTLKLLDGTRIISADLMGDNADSYSQEQMDIFQSYWEELKKYPLKVAMPDGSTTDISGISIMGDSYLTADQLRQWIKSETPRIKADVEAEGRRFQYIEHLEDLYIQIGAEYGVRGDIAFCQAAKETRYWQFTGQVQAWQNNYCGLYATGSPLTGTEGLNGADGSMVKLNAGVNGAYFLTPAAGVEAHIQHLYAYASNKPLPSGKTLLDPRFFPSIRGTAPNWVNLNTRWAVPGTTYGQSIICDYWSKAVASS